ncbi:hypothetical protein ACFOU2_10590 [Bacillus songklensis]|uniref:Uncharacterized protein n=1 Tax=Bacillus songklensis TaxID=1069116 RepID=A0ABV8B2L0_9BACI
MTIKSILQSSYNGDRERFSYTQFFGFQTVAQGGVKDKLDNVS